MRPALSAGQLGRAACLLELSAPKPGNVSRFRDLPDLTFDDFARSAEAIVGPLDRAIETGIGAAVLGAIEATRRVAATNTNLGIVLLLAPLAAVPFDVPLSIGIGPVLGTSTLADARLVYRAIRLARPGGMGQAPEQDLAAEPTLPLRDIMRLAADRDLVARQYADGFQLVLGEALPALRDYLDRGGPLETAIVGAFLSVLARWPDSLIARKAGSERAVEVSARAAAVLHAGWPDRAGARRDAADFDDWLRAPARRFNPGTTADLITAALYAALRDGTITDSETVPIQGTPAAQTYPGFPSMPADRYKVRVTKDYLVFSAGHFITYQGNECERIHGHNYRVAVEVEDELDENHYVVDFIALKDLTKRIVDELDHRMLLPTQSPYIVLDDHGPNIRATYRDRYWSFPRAECVLLPIANTTSELLAGHIAGRLRSAMADRGWGLPRTLRVEVEENFGQSAEIEWRRDTGEAGP